MTSTPAVFLDRDGVTNQNALISQTDQLKIFPFTAPAVKILNRLNLPVIIITNQAVVARGRCSKKDILKIHRYFCRQLETQGAQIDGFYFCPHHPQATLPRYRKDCPNRKPRPGLLFQAATDLQLDLSQSYLIGDSLRFDIPAGKAANTTTILVTTGLYGTQESEKDLNDSNRPDHIVAHLLAAARLISQLQKTQSQTPSSNF